MPPHQLVSAADRSRKARRCCVVCGGPESDFLLSAVNPFLSDQTLFLHRCRSCRAVFLESWAESLRPESFDYYACRVGKSRAELYSPITESRYRRLLAAARWAPGRRLLDVGCGQGQFIDVALKCGWDALGLDSSDAAIAICGQFGLPARNLDVFSPELKPASFDLITMFEVIQHVPSPPRFAARVEELLKPGGLFYVTTSNFNSVDRKVLGADWPVFHPVTLAYFTPSTLTEMIQKSSGLETLSCRTSNISIDTIRRLCGLEIKTVEACRAGLGDPVRANNAVFRKRLEVSPLLRLAKGAVNLMLKFTGLGSTMTMICRKPYGNAD